MTAGRPERLSLFGSLVTRSDQEIPLCQAALLFAADADPDLDIAAYLDRIQTLGADLETQLPAAADRAPSERLQSFLQIFHGEFQFRGDNDEFDAPENSHLHRVLDRRRGLPITLSIVAVELLHRLGLEAYGVALPGRYIARCETERGPVWFDAFDAGAGGGTLLSEAACAEMAAKHGAPLDEVTLRKALSPARRHSTLIRMLNNLVGSYDRREMHLHKAHTLDWLLMLRPGDMDLTLLRGVALYHSNMPGLAMRDLERVLHHRPDGPQNETIRQILALLHRENSQN